MQVTPDRAVQLVCTEKNRTLLKRQPHLHLNSISMHAKRLSSPQKKWQTP
jgi:hypothetical protein